VHSRLRARWAGDAGHLLVRFQYSRSSAVARVQRRT
jgi:hypothetical protein